MTPAASAQSAARRKLIVPVSGVERFEGYSLLALPLSSGYTLAFRRCVTSSIGPPHTTVWQRDTHGRWSCFTDVMPERSCARYYRPALHTLQVSDIDVVWKSAYELVLFVHAARLHVALRLVPSAATRAINATLRALPETMWRSDVAANFVGRRAGALLGAGAWSVSGPTPSGQHFRMRPVSVWLVQAAAVTSDGHDLGELTTTRGGVTIRGLDAPGRGLFVVGAEEFRTS